jgi:Flp pilus assembly protein TadG
MFFSQKIATARLAGRDIAKATRTGDTSDNNSSTRNQYGFREKLARKDTAQKLCAVKRRTEDRCDRIFGTPHRCSVDWHQGAGGLQVMLLVMGCGATTRCLLQRGVDSTEFSGTVLT